MDFKRKKASDLETVNVQSPEVASQEPETNQPAPASTPEPAAIEPAEPSHLQEFSELVLAKSQEWLKLYGWLLAICLLFYGLADYTTTTTAEQRPGQLVFSNTMIQLWTACFRLVFVLGASLGLSRYLMTIINYDLKPFQRVCVFLFAFFMFCFLFIMLLSVNLPQTTSVGR